MGGEMGLLMCNDGEYNFGKSFENKMKAAGLIVTTIKIQVHHPEIWVTKDLFTLKREMLTSIETLKFNFSIELMETGKLRHYCHHIHL